MRRRPADRRKFERVTIDAALAVMHCLTAQETAAESLPPMVSEDISPNGLFVRTTRGLPPGTRVLLRLHLPTMTKPFRCEAVVARVEHRPNGEVRGLGVQFLQLSEGGLQLLMEHLYRSYQVQHAIE